MCYRTKDLHMFPFEVWRANRHNHLFVADAICYWDVGEKAKEVLMSLFEIGHTPTSALVVLKHDLQVSMVSSLCMLLPTGRFALTCPMCKGRHHTGQHGQDNYYPLYL